MIFSNEMTLTIKAKSSNESFARSVVAAFCIPINPTLEEINDIKTAVSEAVTNCIVHAYEYDEKNNITIWASIEDKTLTVKISDTGKGIADINQAMQPFFTTRPQDERSGMGFTVIQAFTDEMEIISTLGVGTTVCMVKTLGNNIVEVSTDA